MKFICLKQCVFIYECINHDVTRDKYFELFFWIQKLQDLLRTLNVIIILIISYTHHDGTRNEHQNTQDQLKDAHPFHGIHAGGELVVTAVVTHCFLVAMEISARLLRMEFGCQGGEKSCKSKSSYVLKELVSFKLCSSQVQPRDIKCIYLNISAVYSQG